jgi:ABC-type amino acid transport substrate-binding protein
MAKISFHFFFFIVASLATISCQPKATISSRAIDTYDRVMASGKIRYGYLEWPPVLQRDANTHEFSGVGVDVITEIAKRLQLKISWDEEVGPATAAESVKSGCVDMMCLPVIITMPRAKVVDFSNPVMFGRFYPWVKQDAQISAHENMNQDRYTFVYIDGTAAMSMTEKLFPKTKHLSLVENSPTSDLFSSVMGGKADAVYADTSNALTFAKHNPGKIRPIENPVTSLSLPWAFMVAQDNYRFVRIVNLVLEDMRYDGTLVKIMQKNHAEDYFTLEGEKPIMSSQEMPHE